MINLDQKEFTYLEYQDFIEKHNLESFSKSQVDAFSRDVLEKSKKQEVDEYEISCAAADYASLHPVTVVREDLTKCIMYWREAQTEGINIPNGIFKSIDDRACRKFKETDLNIFKGIAGINCADKDVIEKAKALPIGTERMWKGKQYVKTANGWIPKSKMKSSSAKESTGEEKKSGDKYQKQKDLVAEIAKKHKLDFNEVWSAVEEDYEDGGLDSLTGEDVYEIIDASGISSPAQKKAEERRSNANSKDSGKITKDYLKQYKDLKFDIKQLDQEISSYKEENKDYENKSFFKILKAKQESNEKKLKELISNKPELNKEVVETHIDSAKRALDNAEKRIAILKEKGIDTSDDKDHRIAWREANSDVKDSKEKLKFYESLK